MLLLAALSAERTYMGSRTPSNLRSLRGLNQFRWEAAGTSTARQKSKRLKANSEVTTAV